MRYHIFLTTVLRARARSSATNLLYSNKDLEDLETVVNDELV